MNTKFVCVDVCVCLNSGQALSVEQVFGDIWTEKKEMKVE